MNKSLLPAMLLAATLCGCSQKSDDQPKTSTTSTNTTNQFSSGNPLTAPVDYLGAVGQAKKHSIKVIDTVQINNAIRQFKAVEDRYPKDLNELVTSGYLAKIPKAPYRTRIVYNPATGQVRIVRQQ